MKNLLAITMLALYTLCPIQSSYAKDIAPKDAEWVATSLTSGNTYLNMAQQNRRSYIIGVIDGLELVPMFFPASDDKIPWKDRIERVENCVRIMSGNQIEAVVTKYLKDNPSLWHLHMNVLVIKALMEVPCYKTE